MPRRPVQSVQTSGTVIDTVFSPPAVAGVALGLAVGAIVWSLLQARRAAELRALLLEREAAFVQAQRDLSTSRQECARVAAQLEAAQSSATEKVALLQAAEVRLREAFAALSSAALQQNNESFLQLARASLSEFQRAATTDLDGRHKALEAVVQPLRDSLTRVDAKLQEVEQGRVADPGSAGRTDARAHPRPPRAAVGNEPSLPRPSFAERPRPMGRASATTRARERRSRRGQPLRAEGIDAGRGRPAHAGCRSSSCPAARTWSSTPRCRSPRISKPPKRTTTRSARAKLRDHARQVKDHVTRLANKIVLGAFPARARHRRHVRSRGIAAHVGIAGGSGACSNSA